MSKPFVIDVKRFYMGGLEAQVDCPSCKNVVKIPGHREYLSYPTANAPFEQWVYCNACEHEWQAKLLLKLSLEVVPA